MRVDAESLYVEIAFSSREPRGREGSRFGEDTRGGGCEEEMEKIKEEKRGGFAERRSRGFCFGFYEKEAGRVWLSWLDFLRRAGCAQRRKYSRTP